MRIATGGLARIGVCLLAASMLALFAACRREPVYSQDSPDAVVASAKAMVAAGRADKLHSLVYADDIYMRAFMVRVGKLLGHTQELALELQRAFPADIEKFKKEAEKQALAAAKKGTATGPGAFLNQITSGARKGSQKDREDSLSDLIRTVFADPYGWLEESSGRLSTQMINDDMSALMWDGKGILPPLGVAMRKDGDKWYLLLPLNVPVLSRYLPKTKDEWSMFASVVKIFDNAVVDLRDEVKQGRVRSFNDVARKAGEKVVMPAAIAFVAIGKHYEHKFAKERAAQPPKQPAGNP